MTRKAKWLWIYYIFTAMFTVFCAWFEHPLFWALLGVLCAGAYTDWRDSHAK